MEEVTGRTYSRLHIVGGGCQDDYLNELTAQTTGKAVYAGPIEATAIGNLLVQMLANGEYASLEEGRTAIAASFDVKPV
jgi:rhamnulokinase